MKINEFTFKITTTNKLVCHRCKSLIDGKEGYVRICTERERASMFKESREGVYRVCWVCFKKDIGEIFKKRRTRANDHDLMTKRRILTGLR